MRLGRLVLGLLATGALMAPVAPVLAAEATGTESITATPTTQRAEIPAGKTFNASADIYNSGTTSYDFEVSAAPFSVEGEDYAQDFTARQGITDASKWYAFSRTKYRLAAGATVTVPYQIRVPAGTGPGGYYAVVFAQTVSDAGGQTIRAQKRVGIIQYLTVAGQASVGGSLGSFDVPAVQTHKPLELAVVMKNTGNLHYDAAAKIDVKDVFGNVKMKFETTKVVLPATSRRVALTWNQAPSFGLFRVEGSVSYLDKTERLPSRYVLMISEQVFLIIGLVVAALVVYLVVGRRRRGNVRRG